MLQLGRTRRGRVLAVFSGSHRSSKRHVRSVHQSRAKMLTLRNRAAWGNTELDQGGRRMSLYPSAALIAGRSRRELEALAEQRQRVEEERALILKFRPFFSGRSERSGQSGLDLDGIRVFYLVLREDGGARASPDARRVARRPSKTASSCSASRRNRVNPRCSWPCRRPTPMKAEHLLSEAGVQSLSLPDQFEEESVSATIERMQARLGDLPDELATIERERRRVARRAGTRPRADSGDRTRSPRDHRGHGAGRGDAPRLRPRRLGPDRCAA